mgnify:CR=1 FL=1
MLEVRDVWREFPSGDGVIAVLKGVSLRIQAGEMVAIMGASGSGKSTLMNILGCLDRPSRGEYRVAGQLTAEMAPDDLARLRREHFGFIFQRYHLLGSLSAAANAEIPAIYAGLHAVQRRERAVARLLERFQRLLREALLEAELVLALRARHPGAGIDQPGLAARLDAMIAEGASRFAATSLRLASSKAISVNSSRPASRSAIWRKAGRRPRMSGQITPDW